MPSVVSWNEYMLYWIGALIMVGVGVVWGIISLIKR